MQTINYTDALEAATLLAVDIRELALRGEDVSNQQENLTKFIQVISDSTGYPVSWLTTKIRIRRNRVLSGIANAERGA